MDTRRWIHLALMIVPVAILTAFNVWGLTPSPALQGALSALTVTAAGLAQHRRPALAAGRKRREHATSDPAKQKRLAPARVATATASDDRGA
jgi:hypothetical protein